MCWCRSVPGTLLAGARRLVAEVSFAGLVVNALLLHLTATLTVTACPPNLDDLCSLEVEYRSATLWLCGTSLEGKRAGSINIRAEIGTRTEGSALIAFARLCTGRSTEASPFCLLMLVSCWS